MNVKKHEYVYKIRIRRRNTYENYIYVQEIGVRVRIMYGYKRNVFTQERYVYVKKHEYVCDI